MEMTAELRDIIDFCTAMNLVEQQLSEKKAAYSIWDRGDEPPRWILVEDIKHLTERHKELSTAFAAWIQDHTSFVSALLKEIDDVLSNVREGASKELSK